MIFEPQHVKTNKMTCAHPPPEDSDQPGHPPSLIRIFAVRSWVAKDPKFLQADSEDSDQTGRMPSAQADLSFRWAHMSFCWFCHVMAHMIISSTFL